MLKVFFPLNIICTWSLFIFIHALSRYIDDLQLLILYWFVDMSNSFFGVFKCFIVSQFKTNWYIV